MRANHDVSFGGSLFPSSMYIGYLDLVPDLLLKLSTCRMIIPIYKLSPTILVMTAYQNIALLFGDIKGCPDINQLSQNHTFVYRPPTIQQDPRQRWRPAVMQALPPSAFCLAFNKKPRSPHGWVFGCAGHEEPDPCDFQLSMDGSNGISRHHFRIEFDTDTLNKPQIVSLSSNRIKIIEPGRVILLSQNEAHEINGLVTIALGTVTIRVWLPTLTPDERRSYVQNVQRFHEDFMDARPISPENHKIGQSGDTAQSRFGLNGLNYIRTGIGGASGTFGTVMQVKEAGTNVLYAVKLLHHSSQDAPSKTRRSWELIKAEFDIFRSLDHVSTPFATILFLSQ